MPYVRHVDPIARNDFKTASWIANQRPILDDGSAALRMVHAVRGQTHDGLILSGLGSWISRVDSDKAFSADHICP